MNELIVVAEDSEEIGSLVAIKLRKEGYKVMWEHRGDQALIAVKKNLPKLVISDLGMPGLTGFELVQSLRRFPETQDIPVIILTASSEKNDVLKGKSLGVVEYVVKPFRLEDLMSRVHRLTRASS